MANVILYARVSTDEQAQSGTSIDFQKEKLYRYCDIFKENIVKYYHEDFSAKQFNNRPEWNKILVFIKANKGLVNKIWVVRWDRFSRNAPEAYQMIKTLNKLGVEINAIEQPIDFKIPEQKMLLSFYLTIPEIENDRRSINTTNGMRRNMREGRYVSTAPFGFKNSRDEMKKPLLIHSDLAPLIKEAFEKFATGTYQKEALRKELYKKGLKVSKNQFCLILENPIYCGKIRLKAFGDEPEEILQGIHEPIVTEELFYRVQYVIAGKRKTTTKYSRINDKYPLRGFIVCSKCGKSFTGNPAKGNGGSYEYYTCKANKCKNETYKCVNVHYQFEQWLGKISFKPEVGSLYLSIMEDVFKSNEGDRNAEIRKLDSELRNEEDFLDKVTEKFVIGDLDKVGYSRMKENTTKRCAGIKSRIAELNSTDSGFKEYTNYGVSLMSNLKQYYCSASLENKQKMLGLIFPEKLVYSNYTFQTVESNEILTLLCNGGKGFSDYKKGLSSKIAAQSYVVTSSGFKPETF